MLFKNRKLKASTAVVALVCFTWMTSGGNAWAEKRAAERDPAKTLLRLMDDPRLALSPQEKEYLRRAAHRMESERRPEPVQRDVPAVPDRAVELGLAAAQLEQLAVPAASATAATKRLGEDERIAGLRQRLETIDRQVLAEFDEVESRLRAARLPQEILQRHEAGRAEYRENMKAVFEDLDAAARSESHEKARSSLAAAAQRLSRSTDDRPHQEFDPSRMPFRAARPTERKPASEAGSGAQQALVSTTASLTLPAPADLAANEDAQITPEIRALAASLGNQPLAIYSWVRNNVEFVPTYGSVQGSQMTLDARRGNAFDTASLLVALLRAAGVPARYVTGTVQVPVAAVMSWVGGAASPNVAQQLLGQGGVPNVGLTSGGQVTHIRLDHVWVEAFIDNVPSRGAVHREGDTWVAMDPAFKLHQLTPASNLFTDVPISSVLQPGDHLFDVDESLGKITNVDDMVLQDRMSEWSAQSDEYIVSHGIAATVAGVVGGKTVIQETNAVFPGSLPYDVVTHGAAVSTLPAGLRHSVTLEGFASQFDRAFGSPAFSVSLSLPALNSQRLGIQFEPATQADADTLAAARNGGATSLPLYLINVRPSVKLDGVAQGAPGGSVRMGSSYFIDVTLRGPDGATEIPFQVIAGDEIVAGVTGNGVSREVVEKRFADHPVDNAPEYLHQVGLHYWAECDYMDQAAAKSLGVHALRLPSVGFFSSTLTASYLFGSPRSGVYQSRNMDVRQSLVGAAGADGAKVTAFVKQSGVQGSYLEGSVFDQLENRETPAVKGVSAVQLIASAAGQGIPIYRITSANAAAALPHLQLSPAVESDISTAVSQGKTVLVPERDLDIGPWSGVGYIIQDEATGGGAYLISGGANGGGLADCIRQLVPRWVLVLVLVLLLILLIILLIMLIYALAPLLAAAGAVAAEAFAAFLLALRGLAPLALAGA